MGIVHHLSFVSSESSMSSTFSDEICFNTTGPIEAKFHLNLPWGRERKVYGGYGSHDKDGCHAHIVFHMVAYGSKKMKINTNELGHMTKMATTPTLTCLMPRSNLVAKVFVWEK